VEEDTLFFGSGLRVSLGGAPTLGRRSIVSPRGLPLGSLASRRSALVETALALGSPRGLGVFLPAIAACRCSLRSWSDATLNAAWPVVSELVSVAVGDSPPSRIHEAGRLIGLGPGLTPSGDDFLGGFLFTWHHLHKVYPSLPGVPRLNGLRAGADRTNAISLAWLRDLAQGEGVTPLHEVVEGLIGRVSPPNLQNALRRLLALGHSTGWDLLTGAVAGLGLSARPGVPVVSPAFDRMPATQEGRHGHQTTH